MIFGAILGPAFTTVALLGWVLNRSDNENQ